jgi:D-alanyl-D-alanine carboxypeptidase/D-alanyl-D-alanine-endopeptidase (penicillin-binding protein 4)
LQMLGPMARFKTTVVGTGNKIVLVGGGDPFLASTPARGAGRYPVRADITTLAQRTAAALKTAGISKVAVGYDASLFTGPAVNSHWPATYISQDVVPPISALWVDEGRGHNGYYVSDPALAAAQTFVAALKAQHIAVSGVPRKQKAPAPAAELAEVESSPVGEIIQQTLALSDNNAAEVLARHVGRVVEHDASFAGGAKGTFAVLTKLGVDLTGSAVYDGSGLSRQTRLTPTALMDVVKAVTSAQHPTLREVITGLPVAGFTGSLKRRFGTGLAAARGRVLAKTGTLTGVHGLVGVAADLDGDLIAFVFVVDRIPLVDNLAAQHQLDVMAGALGACHCGQ